MSIVQMQRIHLCALKKNQKSILRRLQALGAVEIDIRLDDDVGYEKADVGQNKAEYEKRYRMIDRALDVLQEYAPEKTGMFHSLEGKPLVDKEAFEILAGKREYYTNMADTLLSLDKQVTEAKAQIQHLKNL